MVAANVRDVAAMAGVSVGTVSNVLNHSKKVSPATEQRVFEAIETLGFVRNDAARQLRAGRSRSIGMVVLDTGNPFFSDVARGAEDRASEAGFSVLLANSHDSDARENEHVELFEEQRVRGLLLSPVGNASPKLERLRARGIPTVLVDRAIADLSVSTVSVDDVAGGMLAIDHLIAIGRTRIAYVGGPVSIRQVADRLEGARRSVDAAHDVSLEVFETAALSVLEGRRIGEVIRERSRSKRPDAVFAANDLLAVGVLQALSFGSRVRVPDDIALIGYDDIAFASATVVPLSSIRQPSAKIGRTAVDLLLRESDSPGSFEPEQVVFQPTLVQRESTAS
jgi:DNA-binding LacI/PurR family transcriptional regulator